MTTVNAKERLLSVRADLEKLGAKDVKFFFSQTEEKPLSVVANEAADALQDLLDGKVTQIEDFDEVSA